MSPKFSFIKATFLFCIGGIFTPILNMFLLLGAQTLLEKFNIECSLAWTMVFFASIGVAFLFPALFYFHVRSLTLANSGLLSTKLLLFNFLECLFIQVSLASLITNGEILCYGNGGQNGIEFIFTGWLALPFLVLFSIVFELTYRKVNAVDSNTSQSV